MAKKLRANSIAKNPRKSASQAKAAIPKLGAGKREGKYCKKESPKFKGGNTTLG